MTNQSPNQGSEAARRATPAVSRVTADGTLIELLYNRDACRTSFAVSKEGALGVRDDFQLTSGERLVPFSPRNNLIKNDVVLLPQAQEEYGSNAELLAQILTYLHRYVDLSLSFERIAAAYVLLSWVYDAFNELPYLRLRGDYGTGKTRALLVLGSICYKPFFASGASTVSPLFLTQDAFRGTLILDEADFRFSDEKAEIVKILNNGNMKGLPVLRTVMSNNREFNPRAFHVYGPKIVATRGSYDDRALESRFLTEETGQRPLRPGIPINLPDEQRHEALRLRNKLLTYRFRNRLTVDLRQLPSDGDIAPRMRQVIAPLLSVIDDPSLIEEVMWFAHRSSEEASAERGLSTEAQLLEILSERLRKQDRTGVPLREIVASFAEKYGQEYERPITPRYVGSILRRKLRISTYKSHGIYVVPAIERQKIDYLCSKYGIAADSGTPRVDEGTSGRSSDDSGAEPRLPTQPAS